MTAIQDAGSTHHESVDVTRPSRRPQVLMVVAYPGTSTSSGWPVGFGQPSCSTRSTSSRRASTEEER